MAFTYRYHRLGELHLLPFDTPEAALKFAMHQYDQLLAQPQGIYDAAGEVVLDLDDIIACWEDSYSVLARARDRR